ncbi:MAG: hypothetical protein JNL05_14505 [Flavobacteriales bacterium]|nr:hypothetical protein [Flavobacteriales bacterium]
MRLVLLALIALPAVLQAQTLDYRWLNQPCGQVLNCDSGCTACNMPTSSGAVLIGTDLASLSIDVCPHPVTTADNALFTTGWPAMADDQHRLMLSALTLQPLHIDSVVIRHRRTADGPVMLRVSAALNNGPVNAEGSVPVDEAYTTTVFTDLGVVAAQEGNAMGLFQLILQADQGQGGAWVLDEVRIVTSPATLTAIPELQAPRYANAPRYDLLGRPAPRTDAQGVFLDRYKRIRID